VNLNTASTIGTSAAMAPLEDLQSRDLAWISDFVMQQMVIMLRPMMDHLQQTDASLDYVQQAAHRLSMDVAEMRGDLERTNKYLTILRQGLGVQNEGKCVLQRGLEGTVRTTKRLDEQMESILGVMRSVEDSVGQLFSDLRGTNGRYEDCAKQLSETTSSLDTLQDKVDRIAKDSLTIKDDFLSSEARLDVWQRELRELRRSQLGIAPKIEDKGSRQPPSSQDGRAAVTDSWPQKKTFVGMEVTVGANGGGSFPSESRNSQTGGSQQSKRMARVSSGSGRNALQQDSADLSVQPRTASKAGAGGISEDIDGDVAGLLGNAPDEVPANARLPLLAKQTGAPRAPDRSNAEGPRLRFSATMANPPSRGGSATSRNSS